ncbi:outer membrane beta-barrel protein [Oleiharenicola lentus]|uniref:outer membrane beta-barrel protein n=1 Tax=Oleiharenicola lentus TaxID=2508720 RepID=UPI003F66B548
MNFVLKTRLLLLVAAFWVASSPAWALLNIDGSRNQVFVFGSVTFGYSSNIFSESSNRGDYTTSAAVGVELKRRAGIIAVNSTFTLTYQGYAEYSDQSSWNPSFYIEFNKTTGRTTGAFTINAFRESRADSVLNTRTSSWNFPLGLNVKYPINDKLYVTSSTTYLRREYIDVAVLSNLTDYSESVDLFYTRNEKQQWLAGYRIRVSQNDFTGDSYDHWFNVGIMEQILAKLHGSLRFGYQIRNTTRPRETFDQFNIVASLNWPVTRKFALGSQISRDFNTIATGATVESTSISLKGDYTFNRKFNMDASVAYGRNVFLGSLQPFRRDDFFTWDIGANYKFNEHLRVGASYTYYRNWSTVDLSDFVRRGFSVDISSRY